MSAKSLDQMTRGKTSEGLLTNHTSTAMPTNGRTSTTVTSSGTGAMPGSGTLPPKASLSGL